ncbi:MAG TPA: GNAT family N-acetyltransferase, partial [Longimicrobiales bacterium]|nr:GNAT family N-acetyltransferase [Longimicrobiales bacterium]
IKRMYVRAGFRGSGVGRLLLQRLEAEARRRGASSLVLEMGDSQPDAASLYRRAGFVPIPCWARYLATPASICLGKDLGGAE